MSGRSTSPNGRKVGDPHYVYKLDWLAKLREAARAGGDAFLDDGYVDLVRPHAPGPEVFTYWDYRQRYERNRGMRLDFVLGSPTLAARVKSAFIDRDERAGVGASDHAPVVVEIA